MSGSAAPTPTPTNLPSRPPTPEAGSLELLGSYVPQALRRKIALLNSSKKETTISSMFQNAQETSVCALVDLNGFSTLVHDFCEDETDAADLVNDLYSTIVFSVEDYGGDFISIAGDVLIQHPPSFIFKSFPPLPLPSLAHSYPPPPPTPKPPATPNLKNQHVRLGSPNPNPNQPPIPPPHTRGGFTGAPWLLRSPGPASKNSPP